MYVFPIATIDELRIADDPVRWAALGFELEGEELALGSVRVRLQGAGAGRGITGWSLRGLVSEDLDGPATECSRSPERTHARIHPNGVLAIDHVVIFSPQLDRTIERLQAAGLELRRIREEPTPAGAPRQAFFRLGEVILEVVQAPADAVEQIGGPEQPARLWGLALAVQDIDAAVQRIGEHAGEVRAAVQPGRRIATLRRSAGLAVPVALMSPAVSVGAAGGTAP